MLFVSQCTHISYPIELPASFIKGSPGIWCFAFFKKKQTKQNKTPYFYSSIVKSCIQTCGKVSQKREIAWEHKNEVQKRKAEKESILL